MLFSETQIQILKQGLEPITYERLNDVHLLSRDLQKYLLDVKSFLLEYGKNNFTLSDLSYFGVECLQLLQELAKLHNLASIAIVLDEQHALTIIEKAAAITEKRYIDTTVAFLSVSELLNILTLGPDHLTIDEIEFIHHAISSIVSKNELETFFTYAQNTSAEPDEKLHNKKQLLRLVSSFIEFFVLLESSRKNHLFPLDVADHLTWLMKELTRSESPNAKKFEDIRPIVMQLTETMGLILIQNKAKLIDLRDVDLNTHELVEMRMIKNIFSTDL